MSRGFVSVVVFMPDGFSLPADVAECAMRVQHDTAVDGGHVGAVNQVIAASPSATWLFYCFNAEYLLYPFCETRSIGAPSPGSATPPGFSW